MGKRLTITDYILTLAFIFGLICILGAFFYGMKIGKDKTLEKYAAVIKPPTESQQELTAYHQQYLVSFYHTIHLPYREFQKKWFEGMNSLELNNRTVDASAVLKELRKTADEKYNQILNLSMPEASPLLIEAHAGYLKSLKLFHNSLKTFETKPLQGKNLIKEIGRDAYVQEAKNFALNAQKSFYTAIVKWQETVDREVGGAALLSKKDVSLKEWNSMELNVKNQYIANIMAEKKYFMGYYPQDLSLRIDEMVSSTQAQKLQLTEIPSLADMLVQTEGVRQGDFIRGKDRFYNNETLPQLPFYFEPSH
jgi:hypothetical protein